MARSNLHSHDEEYQSSIWDAQLKRKMLVTFVFFGAGLLFAWEYGRIYGESAAPTEVVFAAEQAKREELFWNQLLALYPGYPQQLRQDAVTMGKRACAKLQSGWEPTRVLAFLSQDSAPALSDELPTPAGQTQFWIGLENAAALSLCPQQALKLEGWLDGLEVKQADAPQNPTSE